MTAKQEPLQVSLVAFPEGVVSTLMGIYDVLNSFGMLARLDSAIPDDPPFRVEIVGARRGPVVLASGMSVEVARAVDEIAKTDIVIVPSVVLGAEGWPAGR